MGINSRTIIVLTLSTCLIAGFLGFWLGRFSIQHFLSQGLQQSSQPKKEPIANPLFQAQTASFDGEIAKVSESSVTLKNSKGEEEFKLSPKVVIYKFTQGSNRASASSDLKTIEASKRVLVNFELSDGQYQVSSITYPPISPVKPF